MLIAAGEFMQRDEAPQAAVAPIAAPIAAPAHRPAIAPVIDITEQSPTSLVGTLPPPAAAVSAPEATRPAPRARATTGDRNRSAPRTPAKIKKAGTRPGMLDRLKLRWLKNAFVVRADEL